MYRDLLSPGLAYREKFGSSGYRHMQPVEAIHGIYLPAPHAQHSAQGPEAGLVDTEVDNVPVCRPWEYPPDDQLVMSVFTTTCCFMPLGLLALLKSLEVNPRCTYNIFIAKIYRTFCSTKMNDLLAIES